MRYLCYLMHRLFFKLVILTLFGLAPASLIHGQTNEVQVVAGEFSFEAKSPTKPSAEPVEIQKLLTRFRDYQALPQPEFIPTGSKPTDSNLVTHDLLTGETTNTNAPQTKRLTKGLTLNSSAPGGDGRLDATTVLEPLNAFSAFSEISDPTVNPWVVNVKLFIGRNSGNFVCSGVLIHPRYVLTAGHCVFSHTPGDGFANSIDVVPGYENSNGPVGEASSVRLTTFNGWSQDENFDFDMGLIELDRPIGAITGWHGYGFNTSNSFYSGRTMHNPGYPAEGGFNGQTLQYRFGTIDTFTTNLFRLDPGCFGGHSGAGTYLVDGNTRTVHAVHSFTSGGTTSGQVRFTQSKFDTFSNTISGTTSNSPDLYALDANCSASVTAGQTIPALDYLIYNESSATWNSTTSIDMYLSTNNFISTSDIFLGTLTTSVSSIGPNGRLRVTANNSVTIPSTASGTFYLGGIITNNDSDSFNNATLPDDVCEIVVVPAAPPNDTFANSFAMNVPATVNGTNVSGSFETGEPTGGSTSAQKSVWWHVIAPATGQMTIDTFNSDFDTILDVFTGSQLTSLSLVPNGHSDDNGGSQSEVTIDVVAGRRYEIRVAGFSGDTGTIQIETAIVGSNAMIVGDEMVVRATNTDNDIVVIEAGNTTHVEVDGFIESIPGVYNVAVLGFDGNDTITSNVPGIRIYGMNGDDDILFFGSEANMLIGGNDNDTIRGGSGPDEIYGGAGNDLIIGRAGNDSMFGGTGDDEMRGISGRNLISGGSGNNELYGGTGPDEIVGGIGDDVIFGGNGVDEIRGGAGLNVIDGGLASDNIIGGSDRDVIRGGPGNDTIYGLAGDDELLGDAGSDEIIGGPGNDLILGGPGLDRLFGLAGNDVLFGELSSDFLSGGTGNDQLDGGSGPDELFGGGGNDVLTGGDGFDALHGGQGNDTATDEGEAGESSIEN